MQEKHMEWDLKKNKVTYTFSIFVFQFQHLYAIINIVKFKIKEWKMKEQVYIIDNNKTFEPKHIFDCGQCFRWNIEDDES